MYDYICRCSKNTFKRPHDVFFEPLLSKNVTFCPRHFMNGSAMQARLAILSRLTHYTCLALMWSAALFFFVCFITFEYLQHGWQDFDKLFGRTFHPRSDTESRPVPLRSPPYRSATLLGQARLWGAISRFRHIEPRSLTVFFLSGYQTTLTKNNRDTSAEMQFFSALLTRLRLRNSHLELVKDAFFFFYATTNSSPSCLLQRFLSTNAKSAHVVPFDSIF